MSDDDVPTPVFEALMRSPLLKTLIESAGIATSVDHFPGGRATGEPALFVRRADAEHARELVETSARTAIEPLIRSSGRGAGA